MRISNIFKIMNNNVKNISHKSSPTKNKKEKKIKLNFRTLHFINLKQKVTNSNRMLRFFLYYSESIASHVNIALLMVW